MSQVATHIELKQGAAGLRPRIAGKGVLVQAVVVWHTVLQRSPDEIAGDHGLTLAEVHAALSYYYDHRAEIDKSIWEDEQLIAEMKAKSPSILQQRVRDALADDRVRFYADVHIARAVATALREAGADYLCAEEIGSHDASDEHHLAAAHREGRVIVTQDADFQALHRRGFAHSGIAYFPQGAGIGYIVGYLLLMYGVCSAQDMVGQIEYF